MHSVIRLLGYSVILLFALSPFRPLPLSAQQQPGLTLIAPGGTTSATLVDTNGAVVKTWSNLSARTAYSSYLMPGGYLLRTVQSTGNYFQGGGMSGRIQKHDWEGNLVWDFTYSTQEYCSHHDICPMPNGNVLLIAYERKSAAEASVAGCTKAIEIWSEKVVEVKQTGPTTGEIVWEWKVWDHLVQDVDPNKANYQSSILDHPELININFMTNRDWIHMNGIDYNPTLDQIIVSSHNLNEVWVIDHSNEDSDILYRWGNPAAYGAQGEKVFNVVHDGHFIPHGYVNAGRIVGFNNRGISNQQSSVDMIQPPYNGYTYHRNAGEPYEPAALTRRYACNGYTSNEGNAEQLPNGNTLYCIALSGKIYEIDTAGNTLWTYSSTGKTAQVHRYSECYTQSPISVQATATSRVICKGASTTLKANLYGVASATYQWRSEPAGFMSTSAQVTVSPDAPTTYVLEATASGGCTATSSILIDVRDASPLTIQGPTSVKSGSVATYTAAGVTSATYVWTVDGGTIVSGAGTSTVKVRWNAETSGIISVEATTASGCGDGKASLNVSMIGEELSVTPTSVSMPSETSETQLTVTATSTWNTVRNASWITVAPIAGTGNGTIKVTATENTSTTPRTDTLLVTSGSLVVRIVITQAGKTPENLRAVRFIVDMDTFAINATGIHVAGDFQEEAGFPLGDWQPHTTEMQRLGSSKQYSVTVMLPKGQKWEYKFVNGDQFYDSEFVPEESRIGYDFNDNRWFYLDDESADTFVVGPLFYGGNSGPRKQMIRVSVNMKNVGTISEDGVYAVMYGTNYVPMYSFVNKVYDVQLYYNSDAYIAWRFSNGKDESGKETVTGDCAAGNVRWSDTDADTAFSTVCFGECGDCLASSVREPGTGNWEHGIAIVYAVTGAPVATLRSMSSTIVNDVMEPLAVGVYAVVMLDANGNVVKRFTYLKDR